MVTDDLSHEERLTKIFLPGTYTEIKRMKEISKRFVHYTSAEAALKIINSQEVWLRNTLVMNDYQEVKHGIDCLASAYRSNKGAPFKAFLNSIYPDITLDIEKDFDENALELQTNTFIFSFSEHEDFEDELGRLSMWRAYGGKAGVALVLNNEPFFQENDDLDIYTNFVDYKTIETFEDYFKNLKERIESEIDLVKNFDRDTFKDYILLAFRFTALSTKHSGFREEQEWRLIHTPGLPLFESAQNIIKEKSEIIRGIPQQVYAIPLKEIPEIEFFGASLPKLLNRIIIGPSDASYPISQAFVKALTDAGVPQASSKVFISNIPLRY